MPSPFPGMDPYLEDPAIWPDLHHELISVIREQLNISLRPRYYSRVEERVYISDESDPGRRVIIPDIAIQPINRERAPESIFDPALGLGDLAVAEPLIATTMIDEEIREANIVVVDVAGQQVVTVIEVLSPTNKIVGSRGRASYQKKRQEVLHSDTHLVEIDLLRQGEPIYTGERLPPHDYLVHVSRHAMRPRGTLWPISLTQRLPVIQIPLRNQDADAQLDLKVVLDTAYDRAGYDLVIDYHHPPSIALDEKNANWAKDWLAKMIR